ncbi:MAG: hypothetical protein AAGA66_12255, partial [Bacteroidota bacterium]
VTVYNGRMMLHQIIQTLIDKLNVSGWSLGMHFIRIEAGIKTLHEAFIRNNLELTIILRWRAFLLETHIWVGLQGRPFYFIACINSDMKIAKSSTNRVGKELVFGGIVIVKDASLPQLCNH